MKSSEPRSRSGQSCRRAFTAGPCRGSLLDMIRDIPDLLAPPICHCLVACLFFCSCLPADGCPSVTARVLAQSFTSGFFRASWTLCFFFDGSDTATHPDTKPEHVTTSHRDTSVFPQASARGGQGRKAGATGDSPPCGHKSSLLDVHSFGAPHRKFRNRASSQRFLVALIGPTDEHELNADRGLSQVKPGLVGTK